nr:hypothetical protein [Gemmatimonadaceae bacterium]
MTPHRFAIAVAVASALACSAPRVAQPVPKPSIVPHAQWQTQPPLGYSADATRRNKAAGDSLSFRDLTVGVLATSVDSTGARPADVVRLRLSLDGRREERTVREGEAFNWNGFHVAVVAVYG